MSAAEETNKQRINNAHTLEGGKEAADDERMCCASCGKAEVDDTKLKICTACKLVKYCSVECQKNHRPQHKKACKERAAEIREELLFAPLDESYLGECPICCLPLPLDVKKSSINSCCCKRICDGCAYADDLRMEEQGMEHRCPYCRESVPKTDEEIHQNLMERVKVNDPVAIFKMGVDCQVEGDNDGAVGYYTKAAALGDIGAHYNLSLLYKLGDEKDEKKEVYHLEEAAIGGHDGARNNLGYFEEINGQTNRAMKHYIIAAKLGGDGALEAVKKAYQYGDVSKEDFEAALRGHQAAVDATKSEQRDAAYKYYQHGNQN